MLSFSGQPCFNNSLESSPKIILSLAFLLSTYWTIKYLLVFLNTTLGSPLFSKENLFLSSVLNFCLIPPTPLLFLPAIFFLPLIFLIIIAPLTAKSLMSCFVIASFISLFLESIKTILPLPTFKVLDANSFLLRRFIVLFLLPFLFQDLYLILKIFQD